jgi:hypothetical protein
VNGNNTQSQVATLTVTPGNPSPLQPYIGINFVGGGNNSPGATLTLHDVAGVVGQDHFNNIPGNVITEVPLMDAQGAGTPVTLTVDQASTIGIGSGENSADSAMFQGCIHNTSNPVTVRLQKVPPGTYNLFAYTMGFNFNSTYEMDVQLEGAAQYPLYSVQAQHVGQYLPNPVYRRMRSTDPNARDNGNYVQFENVSPGTDGTMILSLFNQSTNVGVNYHPPLNALQLVKVVPVVARPSLTVGRQGTSVSLSWTSEAAGFRLESASSIGGAAVWSAVAGVPNPIAGAGSTLVTPGDPYRFYRLTK